MEEWRNVVGYENYQVSDKGNVRSVDRTVVYKDGRKGLYKGVMLKPWKDEDGYRHVDLSKNGIKNPTKVATLVARAFHEICGEWFEGCVVDHIIPVSMGGTDEATNLRVCTTLENNNNPLTRKNNSEAHKGKHHSEETKRKMSEAQKGKNTGEKNPMWGKFGAEHHNSKPVIQYSKDGVLFKEWACTSEVERELGINHGNISKCCKGKLKSTGGYIWKYKEEEI